MWSSKKITLYIFYPALSLCHVFYILSPLQALLFENTEPCPIICANTVGAHHLEDPFIRFIACHMR